MYSPPKVDRIWRGYVKKILVYRLFYLLKGDYTPVVPVSLFILGSPVLIKAEHQEMGTLVGKRLLRNLIYN